MKVLGVGQDRRILRGDWMIFRYDDNFDGATLLRVTGRIVAKLTEECATQTCYEKEDYYLLEVSQAHVDKFDDPNNPIHLFKIRDHVKLDLEWGEVPKGQFISVKRPMLEHWHVPGMDMFKQLGLCPRCGENGYWKALALNCSWHGMYI